MSRENSALSTSEPFGPALIRVMQDRGLSLRSVAKGAEVDVAHLSRATRRSDQRRVSGELASRVALSLGLPDDYFVETREARILAAIRADPVLRDRFYALLHQG